MAYNKINWEDAPSTATPLDAENLNRMDDGIYSNSVDIAVIGTNIETLSHSVVGIKESNTNIEKRIDDTNAAIEKVKDEVLTKADKADTLAGYGITDAYDKKYLDKALNNKLIKMPFDTVPVKNSPNYVTSGTLYNSVNALNQSIAAKYDSSNFESGTGELSPAQTIYEGSAGSFNYVKNGKVVTVSVNITKLVVDKSYIQMAGLPFPVKNESKLSSFAVYSTASNLKNIRLDGSWLYISSTDKFVEGEKINFIITYIIR